jgi:hypothetical protein
MADGIPRGRAPEANRVAAGDGWMLTQTHDRLMADS